MKFSEISEAIKYPPQYRANIQSVVADIIAYVSTHIPERLQGKKNIIECINKVAYLIVTGESLPDGWTVDRLNDGLPDIDSGGMLETLGDCYIYITDITWDITDHNFSTTPVINLADLQPTAITAGGKITPKVPALASKPVYESSIEDIYLMPKTPQFDIKDINRSKTIDELQYVLYNSVPRIPTKQCEVSMTTNVDEMTEKELLALFPTKLLYPRSAELYADIPGVKRDEQLGNLILINGYTEKQMVENIIKYPFIHNLKRLGKSANGYRQVDFWKYIEIDGELQKTLEVWDNNSKFRTLPKNKAIIEDVVVRNYLLRQDSRAKQKYQFGIYGELQPFLMLFMPAEMYAEYGYTDSVELARQCVIARVNFIKSRNPVLRKLEEEEYSNV